MNHFRSNPQRARHWLELTLLLVSLTGPLIAQTSASRTNPLARLATERFLLIVDTSATMEKRGANVEQVVGKLFAEDMKDQLHPGDTIGVWTYTDELHAGQFPLRRWTPQMRTIIAQNIVDFLKSRKYENSSRLAPVLAQLQNVVADSERITVLLISDGGEAPTGTPYDAEIAEAYQINAADQRKQQTPFLTVLRAAKGKFTGFTVNTPPWPIEFPVFPALAKAEPPPAPPTAVPSLPLATTAPPASVPAPAIISPVPPVPVFTSPPPAPPLAVSNPPVVIPAPVIVPKTNAVVPLPAAASAGRKSFPLSWLLAGTLLLLGVGVVVLILLLRSRSQPRASLITRSIDRDLK